jgi:hypothetical protein
MPSVVSVLLGTITPALLISVSTVSVTGDWGTSPQTRAMRVAIEAALRINEALAEWAEWAQTNDVMSDEEFGTTPIHSGDPE